MTSDPATLVAMLYDKTVSCLKAAVQAIHNDDVETRWNNNHRAQEIITHMFRTLDLEKGGEVASNLEALYGYMLLRLPDVDANNDARVAEEVIELLEPLRASWNELAENSADYQMDQWDIDAIAAVAVGSAA
jgi:flagellar protein FliS